jgi:hypothetical protein
MLKLLSGVGTPNNWLVADISKDYTDYIIMT